MLFRSRINSDVSVVVNGVSGILPTVFSLVTRLLSAFFAMFMLDRTFALIAIAIGPPVIAAATLYSKKMKSLHKKTQEAEGKTSAFMQESLQNMRQIEQNLMKNENERARCRLEEIRGELRCMEQALALYDR